MSKMSKKIKMSNDLFVQDLMNGAGTLKYYDYFVSGIKLKSKKAVYDVIILKLPVIRKDKIDNSISKFDYNTLSFNKGESQ